MMYFEKFERTSKGDCHLPSDDAKERKDAHEKWARLWAAHGPKKVHLEPIRKRKRLQETLTESNNHGRGERNSHEHLFPRPDGRSTTIGSRVHSMKDWVGYYLPIFDLPFDHP